ncbi:MAG: CPBP family intramembrane metalloprotease [Candidatus Methanoplasma sp.]|nr:CPBP family intramembrane metalloprotease [Candidatus Methanoplasma sp.]
MEKCPRCKEYAARGNKFCGVCGNSLRDIKQWEFEPAPKETKRGFLYIVLLAVCAIVLAAAVFEVITLLVYAPEVFDMLSGKVVGFFLLLPFPEIIFYLDDQLLQYYWVFVVVVITACAAYTLLKLIKAIRRSGDQAEQGTAENAAGFWVGVFLSAMFFINIVTALLWTAVFGELTVPDFGSKIEQIFLLADAAFWEEIVTRLLLIGVPMVIISLIVTKKKESLKCLFGGFGMSMTAAVLIIISGAIFGMAHYSGWDDQAWKVITAGIMGVFLGYLFVRFGLYASILMHFVNNYLQSFDWMGFGEAGALFTLFLFGVGIIALCYMIGRLFEYRGEGALPNFHNGYIKEK